MPRVAATISTSSPDSPGMMHRHLVSGDGFEVELVDVEVPRAGRVLHGECDRD